LHFGVVLHPQCPPDVYLQGASIRQSMLSRDHFGPRAVVNALERLARAYEVECRRIQQELTIAKAQLRDYESRVGLPFPHDSYLAQLTALRDELKKGLSRTAQDSDDALPTVSELAEQIKLLKASQVIEAVPHRIGTRRG